MVSGPDGAVLGTLAGVRAPKGLFDAGLSADGARLLAADLAGRQVLWDVDRRRPLRVLGIEEASSASLSSDGRVVLGIASGMATLWDAATGERRATLDLALAFGAAGPAGERIASSDLSGRYRISEPRTGRSILLDRRSDLPTEPFFAPDGSIVVSWVASFAAGHQVVIWDALTGVERAVLGGSLGGGTLRSSVLTPAADRVVLYTDHRVVVVDLRTGRTLAELATALAHNDETQFSPDGDHLLVQMTPHAVEIWATAEERRSPLQIAGLLAARLPFELRDGAVKPRLTRQAEVQATEVVVDDPQLLVIRGEAIGGRDGARYVEAAVAQLAHRLAQAGPAADRARASLALGRGLRSLGEQQGATGEPAARRAVATLHAAIAWYAALGDRDGWAGAQVELGAALWLLALRTHDAADWRAVPAAYARAQRVHGRAAHPDLWSRDQTAIAEVQAARELWSESATAAVAALAVDPDSARARSVASVAYHERLFDFAAAERVTRAWSARHPDDLDGLADAAEAQLTAGQLAAARGAAAALAAHPKGTPGIRLAMRAIELTATIGLGRDGEIGAALAALDDAAAAFTASGATSRWGFVGTEHYLAGEPRFAAERDALLAMLRAIDVSDIAALRAAVAARRARAAGR